MFALPDVLMGEATRHNIFFVNRFAVQWATSSERFSIRRSLDNCLRENERWGTTVRIYLPRATSEEARAAESADVPRDLLRGTETVLVEEDNERLRQAAFEQLSSLGYKTLEAANPGAALMMLARHPEIALIYGDVVMPGPLTGYGLASEARKRRPDLKTCSPPAMHRHRSGIQASRMRAWRS